MPPSALSAANAAGSSGRGRGRFVACSTDWSEGPACAADDAYNPLDDYDAVEAMTVLDAPTPTGVPPENQAADIAPEAPVSEPDAVESSSGVSLSGR